MVLRWINDFEDIISLVKRLETQEGDYNVEVTSHSSIIQLIEDILQMVSDNDRQCEQVREAYLKFSELWKV